MSPITHLLISWSVSNTINIDRRDHILVTIAGVIPDIDGAGLIFDVFNNTPDQQLQMWSK